MKKRFKTLFSGGRPILAVFLLLGSSGASGDSYTEVSECGTVINVPGEYRLVQDLDCSGSANPRAISILNTEDVELKLDGYQIKGRFNQTYGGAGIGIWIVGSNDIKIDGEHSSARIFHFANAIHVQNSQDVELDGSRMQLRDNTTAVLILQSQAVKVRRLRFGDNRQRDLQIAQSGDVEVRDLDHYGTTSQGILVSESDVIELRDVNIGQYGKVARAVIFYNTSHAELRNSRIDQADVAVLIQGEASHSNRLRGNRFGRDIANGCDLQILFGASAPQLNSNNPSSLIECS